MDCNLTFRGRNSHHIENASGIPADKLYEMRGILAGHIATKPKGEAVFRAALETMETVEGLEDVSISDMWYYGMYINYVDLFDGDEESAMQSWRAVSGNAVEMFVEWFYQTTTPDHISVQRVDRKQRKILSEQLGVDELDAHGDGKIDLAIGYERDGSWYIIGGAHVKPSFKGRMQHDVQFSKELMELGLFSPVLTLDIWSPKGEISNEGQLNSDSNVSQSPRLFVEENGDFTNMYSLNSSTEPTNDETESGYGVKVVSEEQEELIQDIEGFADEFFDRDDFERFEIYG